MQKAPRASKKWRVVGLSLLHPKKKTYDACYLSFFSLDTEANYLPNIQKQSFDSLHIDIM